MSPTLAQNSSRLSFSSKQSHILTIVQSTWLGLSNLALFLPDLTCCHFPHDHPTPAALTCRIFFQHVKLSLEPFALAIPSVWDTQLLPTSLDKVSDLCYSEMPALIIWLKILIHPQPPISYLLSLHFFTVVVAIHSTMCVCLWMYKCVSVRVCLVLPIEYSFHDLQFLFFCPCLVQNPWTLVQGIDFRTWHVGMMAQWTERRPLPSCQCEWFVLPFFRLFCLLFNWKASLHTSGTPSGPWTVTSKHCTHDHLHLLPFCSSKHHFKRLPKTLPGSLAPWALSQQILSPSWKTGCCFAMS